MSKVKTLSRIYRLTLFVVIVTACVAGTLRFLLGDVEAGLLRLLITMCGLILLQFED